MTQNQIAAMQERLGVTPDGFWGPRSIHACQRHLKSLMPKDCPWPSADPTSLQRFYGDPGKNQIENQLVLWPVPAGVDIRYEGKVLTYLRCHRLVGESLLRVLHEIAAGPHTAILQAYAGIYNHRPMRGGSAWSLHAYGAAIDLDPGRNGNHTHWPSKATMSLDVMEAFAREGWMPAGAFWSRDAMHFQATRA
jgi:hypothetical protein